MKCNMGKSDRIVRGIVGLALLVYAFAMGMSTLNIVLGVIGVVFVVTAVTSFCPLYTLLGIDSGCHSEK